MVKKYLKQAQETIQNVDLISSFENGFNLIGDATGNLNAKAIDTATEVVSDTVQRVAAWQDLSKSAINVGLQLTAKQQELVFDSLEGVKDQFTQFRNHWSTLIGKVDTETSIAAPKAKPSYSKTAIKKMKEAELVTFAQTLGIKSSTDDLKKDTVEKVLVKLGL